MEALSGDAAASRRCNNKGGDKAVRPFGRTRGCIALARGGDVCNCSAAKGVGGVSYRKQGRGGGSSRSSPKLEGKCSVKGEFSREGLAGGLSAEWRRVGEGRPSA